MDLLCLERISYREAPTEVLALIREENAGLSFSSNVVLKRVGRIVRHWTHLSVVTHSTLHLTHHVESGAWPGFETSCFKEQRR